MSKTEKQDLAASLADAREFKMIAMRIKFLNELLGYVISTDFENLIDDIKHLIGYLDCLTGEFFCVKIKPS